LPSRTLRLRRKPIGLLVVVSAPSGAGKTTIANAVLRNQRGVVRSISFTSRPKREEEVNGKDYFFVTREEFMRMREKGLFVEWAEVHGNLYGTPREWLEKKVKEGLIVLLVIDVQGAEQIRNSYPGAVTIFILPPSMKELRIRLQKRNTETRKSLTVRIRNAMIEYKFVHQFDYAVVNDVVDDVVQKVTAIILAEKCRVNRWISRKEDKDAEEVKIKQD
jgi:guanylate kinase